MESQLQIARCIDHTILKPEATQDQVCAVVAEAVRYRFASVCVNPCWVSQVSRLLLQAKVGDPENCELPVATCGCVGFPFGTAQSNVKAFEAAACIRDGAQEIDMVIFIPSLLCGDLQYACADVLAVVAEARSERRGTLVKVILETALLNEEQIALGCLAAQNAGADFVKTSTGFHPAGGASIAAVQMLKTYAGSLKVKASGGIRNLSTALAMLEAGADRLGCSASVSIVEAIAIG